MPTEKAVTKGKGTVMGLKNEYIEIGEFTITYGDMYEDDLLEVIPYMVERKCIDGGIDFATGTLPYPAPKASQGFNQSELNKIESLMRDGMPVIYEQARGEGVWADNDTTSSGTTSDPFYSASNFARIDAAIERLEAGEGIEHDLNGLMTTVSVEIPTRIWKQAERILSDIGLSADDAVAAYFALMAERGGVPLDYNAGTVEFDHDNFMENLCIRSNDYLMAKLERGKKQVAAGKVTKHELVSDDRLAAFDEFKRFLESLPKTPWERGDTPTDDRELIGERYMQADD